MALTNTNCSIEISRDGMEALLTLQDESALEGLSVELLRAALASASVRYGIDEAALAQIAANPPLRKPVRVAAGAAAQDAQEEEIFYHFRLGLNSSPVEGEDGTVDFRNLDNFNSTPAGTVIAERRSRGEGRPGSTVRGEALPPKAAKAAQLKVGKGAALSPDGLKALAQVSGHACVVADRITVMETIEIPAHVDFSVGNVKFIGNVRIRGGVQPGFSVEAGRDIEIGGNVEKASISAAGKLSVRGIVFGHGEGVLRAGGDMHLGALDQARVEVSGDLQVDQYIRHSTLLVGGHLHITGQKGSLIGGEALVYRNLDVPNLGNAMSTLTKVTVGSNPFASAGIAEQETIVHGLGGKANQIQAAIQGLMARRKAGATATPEETALLNKYSQAHVQLKQQIDAALAKIEELRHQSGDNKDARVKVSEVAYPGVLLSFRGRLQYKTKDELARVVFYEKDAEVVTGPY